MSIFSVLLLLSAPLLVDGGIDFCFQSVDLFLSPSCFFFITRALSFLLPPSELCAPSADVLFSLKSPSVIEAAPFRIVSSFAAQEAAVISPTKGIFVRKMALFAVEAAGNFSRRPFHFAPTPVSFQYSVLFFSIPYPGSFLEEPRTFQSSLRCSIMSPHVLSSVQTV